MHRPVPRGPCQCYEAVMNKTFAILLAVAALSPAYAKKAKKAAGKPVAAAQSEADARTMLEQFSKPGADIKALTEALRPTPEDMAAVYDPTVISKAQSYYSTLWSKDATVTLKADQTDLKLFHATTDELLTGAPPSQKFPLGWRNTAKVLKKGLTFYSWKWAAPGDDKAQLYDGLVSVNGHWAWFPKIWNSIK
jgi:hypothetical protein